MPKLFVASCKPQDEDFNYRVLDGDGNIMQGPPKIQKIGAGKQVQIYKDASEKELMFIVNQHTPYGMVHVSDIDRTKPFINLCYQFDKPMTENQIMYGMEHNEDALVERGNEIRKASAVALNNVVDKAVRGVSGKTTNALEVSITEQTEGVTDNSKKLTQTIRIDKNA